MILSSAVFSQWTWINHNIGANGDLFTSVYFADINYGWIVGISPTCYRTTNGGTNWTSYDMGSLNGGVNWIHQSG